MVKTKNHKTRKYKKQFITKKHTKTRKQPKTEKHHSLKIVKLPSLFLLQTNTTTTTLIKLNKQYLPLYFKFNKYQFIVPNYHLKHPTNFIQRKTYKKPLIITKQDLDIDKIILNNYLKQFNTSNNQVFIIDLTISHKQLIAFIQQLNKNSIHYDIKVFPHDLTKIYCIPSVTNTNTLNTQQRINNIILDINNIILAINKTIYLYNQLIKKHKPSKDFYEIVEHLIFNASFDYLKQFPQLFDKINPEYKNQFNEKRETLFSNNKYIQLYYPPYPSSVNKLMFSNVGLYSISKPVATQQILTIIKQHLNNLNLNPINMTITDATAGLGGDTIAFAHEFAIVNSVEIQEAHHKAIKNNAELFNLSNIKHINADYTKVYNTLKQDIVFIDSPWGGTEYSASAIAELKLFGSKLSFIDFIKKLLENQTIIFLKTPRNFDLEGLNKIINKTKNKLFVDNVYNFLLITIY